MRVGEIGSGPVQLHLKMTGWSEGAVLPTLVRVPPKEQAKEDR